MLRRYLTAGLILLLLLAAQPALSNSYNRPTIDGRVSTLEGDWMSDELAAADPPDDNRWGSSDGDLVSLWVTWDADSLYVGVKTTNGPSGLGNGYLVFVDTDAQNGITGATDFGSADFYARQITFSTMGADAMMGVWNLDMGSLGIRHCSDPTATEVIEETYTQINPGFQHIEFGISWDGLYGLGEGVVPTGTTLRFIAAIVGGDGSGAYDAMPTSSTGAESDISTEWNAYTDLDVYVEVPVDANGDGVPDEGYPANGKISGLVTLDDPLDDETVVTVTAYQGGVEVWSDNTPAGGGEYRIERLADGTYDVGTQAPSYLPEMTEGVVVTDGGETTGVDFTLTRVTGRIEGEVELTGGPAVDVTVTAYDATTGAVGGDGPQVVTGGAGSFAIVTVVDGTWRVVTESKGYVGAEVMATITDGDTTDVGGRPL